jgi:hypothetical protein
MLDLYVHRNSIAGGCSRSGIRCFFDPWIRDLEGEKSLNLMMRSGSGVLSTLDPGWKKSDPGSKKSRPPQNLSKLCISTA